MEREALRKFILENGNHVNVGMIANKFYPNSVSIDTEGRTFNRATSVVARVLRKKRWEYRIAESTYKYFRCF